MKCHNKQHKWVMDVNLVSRLEIVLLMYFISAVQIWYRSVFSDKFSTLNIEKYFSMMKIRH